MSEFIKHIDEFGKIGDESNLNIIHEKVVMDVWEEEIGIIEGNEKDYDLSLVKNELPETFVIADLTDKPNKTGFAWGKSGPNAKIVRLGDALVWVIEKKAKQGFLSKLFSRKK